MNRSQRREFRAKRKNLAEEYLRNNFFMRTGCKLFWKATGRSLDVQSLAGQFSQKTLARHNQRIIGHPELAEADIKAEVIAMLFSKPGDQYYPVISAKNQKWPVWLGLNPDKGYYANLFNLVKALIRVGQAGRWVMCNYLFSNDIARRYGLNKGRQRNEHTDGPAFVSRETTAVYDHDAVTTSEIDQIETQDLYQRTLAIYNHMERADQLVIRANQANTFEAGFRLVKGELASRGITTVRGAKKRLLTIEKRYPELKDIKQAINT